MKLLITGSKAIISFGQFVFAQGENEVVDTEELTVAAIKEIANANNVSITAKKKADIVSQIHDHLVENNYTEESTMSDTEKFEQIIVDGFAAEKSDNDIKSDMFKAGCDFGDINKIFNKTLADKKLRLTPKDRNEKAVAFLEGYVPEAENVEAHLSKVAALQDHLKCTTTQAGASMRAWAKLNDIELPKAPATPTATPGFRGNQKLVADYAIANKEITFEQLVKFAADNVPKTKGDKDNSRGYAVSVWNSIIFAKAFNAPVVEAEVEVEEATEEAEEEMV